MLVLPALLDSQTMVRHVNSARQTPRSNFTYGMLVPAAFLPMTESATGKNARLWGDFLLSSLLVRHL